VLAVKQFYSSATPSELGWVLAPVSTLVGWVTGTRFVFDASQGWVSYEARFVIAPVCAGLNFALAAFAVLVVTRVPAMRRPGAIARSLVGAAALAYAATILADALRIALAMWTHASGDAHQALGVAVYLGALCAIYAIARRTQDHAVVR
jgi:exosortase K